MSATPDTSETGNQVDCFKAWGLAVGERAFYAESLGQLYYFVSGAFLNQLHPGDDVIESAFLINFHIGLSCEGDYKVYISEGHETKKHFRFSLTNAGSNGILQKIDSSLAPNGQFTFATCSPAVIVESYRNASHQMRSFMEQDYAINDRRLPRELEEASRDFETAVMARLTEVHDTLSNLNIHVFRTAAELPLTVLYLKFKRSVVPSHPDRQPIDIVRGHENESVRKILAIGLYDTRYATDVVQQRKDIYLPVQILVERSTDHSSHVHKQISKLVSVYSNHIRQHAVAYSHARASADATRIFIAHYTHDKQLAETLAKDIERLASINSLNCKCTPGVSVALSKGGNTILGNLIEQAHSVDYAIVLLPDKPNIRHNVPFELGLFWQRFMSRDENGRLYCSRVIVVGKPSSIFSKLSDIAGVSIVERPTGEDIIQVASRIVGSISKYVPFLWQKAEK